MNNTIRNFCIVERDNNTTAEILWIQLQLKRQENLYIAVLNGKQESKYCIKELEEGYEVIEKSISNYTETNNKIILVTIPNINTKNSNEKSIIDYAI